MCTADMRGDVQDIFKQTPHDKQVMMFSATLSAEIRPIIKKFMSDVCPPLGRLPAQPGDAEALVLHCSLPVVAVH